MADDSFGGIRPGIYNIDYFSGSQVALYIGDVFVDEVTAINFVAQQNRRPLYGYGDKHFRAMSKGQVLVQGQFSVNFKEAGYLWLILNEYKIKVENRPSLLERNPFKGSAIANQQNIEDVINNKNITQTQRYDAFQSMASVYADLTGFSSTERAAGGIGDAENRFEGFEDKIWGLNKESLLLEDRSPDDEDLNPFDLYLMYGDFMGDNNANHTIVKLQDVYIIGSSQRIEIDPLPVQEIYSFYAKARI